MTRPTSDKVKESIFSILTSCGEMGGKVLDLFAGSGALGIEALSRGASSTVFVDKNPNAVAIIRKNLALVGKNDRVYNTDWKVALRKLQGSQFDIIFVDPPYALGIEEDILTEISDKNLLSDDGVIIVEHSSNNAFHFDKKIYTEDKRSYSGTCVTFLRKRISNTCVFPGSFNPFTLGHRHLAINALRLYDRVIVAVSEETYKDNMLDAQIRAKLAAKSLADLSGIDVQCFSGMLTDFLADKNCFNIVRGYRNDNDYEYEKELESIYLSMDKRVNFVLLKSDMPEISSEAVRKKIKENADLSELVSEQIIDEVKELYK